MDKSTRVLLYVFSILLTACLTFTVTAFVLTSRGVSYAGTLTAEPAESLDAESKLKELRGIIDEYFIGEIDEKVMTDALAAGMVEGLQDEWSLYLPAEEYGDYMETIQNSYVGIGVTITKDEQERGFLITDVTPESPAYRAGLETGDLLTGVNGASAVEIGMEETKNRVRGEEGTDVTLTVLHGDTEREVVITRARIAVINVVSEQLEGDVAYIKIKNFERNTAQDTVDAIEAALDSGAKGIVFDVRFNPGGLKNELVELLDYLLPEGPLFRSVDYSGYEYVDSSDPDCLDIPMAVLVNEDSYSAAEFFAAALQEYEAATIVGTQTYGKGYFQTVIPLSDGSAVNLSIGKYTTPQGKSLVGVGITPDRVVEVSDETYADIYYSRLAHADDEQLQEAIAAITH